MYVYNDKTQRSLSINMCSSHLSSSPLLLLFLLLRFLLYVLRYVRFASSSAKCRCYTGPLLYMRVCMCA